MGRDKKKPEGGVDHSTLQPTNGPTYTLRVMFHSASHLPIGDIPTGSSDPYILAQCNGPQPTRHKVDPPLRFRSATTRRTLDPKWDAEWVIAGVPASGCELKIRVYDEDNGTHDDLLGRLHLHTGPLSESYSKSPQAYELTKRGANLRTLGLRHCMMAFNDDARKDMTLTVSLEVLGRTKVEVGKCYTVNSFWWTHYSPILGRVVNTTSAHEQGEQANFQANQLQLVGPVPNELYHRYVDFSPIMPWMFERKGLRGRALHAALHRQHEQVYHFDAESEYGRIAGPGKAMAQRFLDMTRWGEGNRIFTYVLTLDGMMRFTETGPEFGIDMLSKHTMHSDVNIYIAYSGEFFVRKYRPGAPGERVAAGHERSSLDIEIEDEAAHAASASSRGEKVAAADQGLEVRPRQRGPDDSGKARRTLHQRHKKAREAQYNTPPEEDTLHGPDTRGRSTDPADYELVIDNDSGTYRPDKGLLPVLAKYLRSQFGELHVAVLSCDDDVDQQIKKKRLKAKAKAQAKSGRRILYRQSSSSSSMSSSEEEDFEAGRAHHSGKEKGVDFISDPGAFLKERYSHRKDKLRGHMKHAKGSEEGEEDDVANSGEESIKTDDVVDTPDGTTNPGTPEDTPNEMAATSASGSGSADNSAARDTSKA